MAAITNVPYSVSNPKVAREVAIIGTKRLLGASLRDDVVRVMMLVMGAGATMGGTLNISTGLPTTVTPLPQLLMQLFGVKGLLPNVVVGTG